MTLGEFKKSFLETYSELTFPLPVAFARGFNRVIPLKAVADVLLQDVGGLRKADGRWPLVVDASGRTGTFIQYTGAAVFTVVELQAMEPLRLRRAFLGSLLHGGALLIDLGAFDVKIEVLAEKFNDLEKGLFAKLLDRSVLLLDPRLRSSGPFGAPQTSMFVVFHRIPWRFMLPTSILVAFIIPARYSYLLPRRFKSLITKELAQDFQISPSTPLE